jgi:hypothetical protein
MQELSRRTCARLLTDIAFATTLVAAASFGIAAAQAQTDTAPRNNAPLDRKDDKKIEPKSSEPTTTGESRAAPAPQLPADQTRPPVSGKPLDEPGKELQSAPPEKIEGK